LAAVRRELAAAGRDCADASSSRAGEIDEVGKKRSMKVGGHVTGISYLSAASMDTVAVVLARMPSFESAQLAMVRSAGAFEFPAVPPGLYDAIVMGGATPVPPRVDEFIVNGGDFAYRIVDPIRVIVTDSDVIGVELPPPTTVFGRVIVEGGYHLPNAQPPSKVFSFIGPMHDAADLHVELRSEQPSNTSWAFPTDHFVERVRPRSDGLFSFDFWGTLPGKDATIHVSGLPYGSSVKSISYGAVDLLKAPLKLDGALKSEILITLVVQSDPAG
jgi:hypothetical protein